MFLLSIIANYSLTLCALAVCGLAITKGAPAERGAGVVVGLAWVAALIGRLLIAVSNAPFGLAPYVYASVDAAGAVGLLIVALRYPSLWVGIAVLIQSAELAVHATFLTGDGSGSRGYIERINFLGILLLWLILMATLVAWFQRVRQARRTAAAV
jgi:hypothetical protein